MRGGWTLMKMTTRLWGSYLPAENWLLTHCPVRVCSCIHHEPPKICFAKSREERKTWLKDVTLFCSDKIQSDSLHGDCQRQWHRCICFSQSDWRPGGHRRSAAGQLQKQRQQVWERKCGYIQYLRHTVELSEISGRKRTSLSSPSNMLVQFLHLAV